MTQLSDEILIAYGDGELGAPQIRLVDGVLAEDAPTLEQFQRHVATGKHLSRAFSSMLEAGARQLAAEQLTSQSVQSADQAPPAPQATKRNILVPAVAASVVLLALGAMGGYLVGNPSGMPGSSADPFATANFWNKEQVKAEEARSKALLKDMNEPQTTAATPRAATASSPKWYELVAARHRADAAGLLEQFNGKSRNRELALFQFSDPDVAPAMIPVLKEEDLTFVGASPVQIKGKHYARLAYRDLGNGAVPVGLYVGQANGGSLTLERGYRDNDNYVRWTQGARTYMLIGAVPHWRLIVLSVSVQRQLVR